MPAAAQRPPARVRQWCAPPVCANGQRRSSSSRARPRGWLTPRLQIRESPPLLQLPLNSCGTASLPRPPGWRRAPPWFKPSPKRELSVSVHHNTIQCGVVIAVGELSCPPVAHGTVPLQRHARQQTPVSFAGPNEFSRAPDVLRTVQTPWHYGIAIGIGRHLATQNQRVCAAVCTNDVCHGGGHAKANASVTLSTRWTAARALFHTS